MCCASKATCLHPYDPSKKMNHSSFPCTKIRTCNRAIVQPCSLMFGYILMIQGNGILVPTKKEKLAIWQFGNLAKLTVTIGKWVKESTKYTYELFELLSFFAKSKIWHFGLLAFWHYGR